MIFTAARTLLAPALARAGAIVPGRTPLAILHHLLLEASAAGMSVTATDFDVMYREQIDTVPRDPWAGCVDAERVEAFVTGAPADAEVSLRPDDEGRLTLRAGRASCRLPTLPSEDFPLFDRHDETAVALTFDAAALVTALRAVAPAISDEKSRHYLCGAYLHDGRLVATDAHLLALRTIDADVPPAPEIIIPAPTVARLVTLLRGIAGPVSVTVGRIRLVASAANWTLASKLIDANYPDYRRVLPERVPCPLLVRRTALREAAALIAKVQQGDKSRGLRLTVGDGELLIESAGYEALGTCEITVPIDGAPPDLPRPVGLNESHLLAALDAIDAEIVELHIAAADSPVWLCGRGETHDGTVIMPMRI